MSALTLSGWVQPVDIIILGLVLGTVNAFDMPARQALVHKLVAVEDLPNAVALNSSMINAARIIGPGVAGIVVAKLGEGACFLINAISYLAVIVALLAMKLPRQSESATRHLSLARSLTAGIRYTFATAPIRDVLLLLGVVGVMGMPYITLMPVFAADIHKRRGCSRLDDGRGRSGRADRRTFAGVAQVCYRPWSSDRGRDFGVRRGLDRFYFVKVILAIAFTPRRRRYGLDGVDRCEQYRVANPRRRRHARSSDESFFDDACRHGAFRQPVSGLVRRSRRCSFGCRGGWHRLRAGRFTFSHAIATHTQAARPILVARGIIIEPTPAGETVGVDPT